MQQTRIAKPDIMNGYTQVIIRVEQGTAVKPCLHRLSLVLVTNSWSDTDDLNCLGISERHIVSSRQFHRGAKNNA